MDADYSKNAAKVLNGMTRKEKQRIRAGITEIPTGDIKPLKGSKGSYRLRIGGYRIIFSYLSQDKVLVEKIGPRGDVYKK